MAQFLWIVVQGPILTAGRFAKMIDPQSWSWKPTVISSTFDPTSGVNPATLSCKAMFICSSKERIVQHTARVSTATQAAADGIGRCILRLRREICQKYAENCWALGLGGFPAPMFFSSWTLIGHFYIPLFDIHNLIPDWIPFKHKVAASWHIQVNSVQNPSVIFDYI